MRAGRIGQAMVRVKVDTRKRLKGLLRDPRPLLEAGFPNPQSVDDVINGLLDYFQRPEAVKG